MDNLYTIMPLRTDRINEICEDIKYQYEKGVATCALFKMTLVPEGTPPADKASIMSAQYVKFKEKLDKDNIPNGILVQASIGHGWKLGEPFPYQRIVGMVDGKSPEVVCPYDEGFKEYIYDAIRKIAKTNPGHIMIDDDFRLISRPGLGCGCPLHMKRFNELAGTDFTREELLDVLSEGTALAKEYNDIFVETQRESLVETAKVMRKAIDSVNPKIPGSFCCDGEVAEFADEITPILAGEGNPSVLRINNGCYNAPGPRSLTFAFFYAASQIAKVKDVVDVVLDEPDTCPQNRYSTSKSMLHSHLTGSLLEGASGAKHWITRLGAYEPESGMAYRQILSKNRGFYDALSEISKNVKWEGFRIPIRNKAYYHITKEKPRREMFSAWCKCVLDQFGLPVYFSPDDGGILCLEGSVLLSDEEILSALKGFVILASNSAEELIERGFGKYLGVDVREWHGKIPMGDKILDFDNVVSSQNKVKELAVTDDNAVIESYICNSKDKVYYEELFPGTVVYKNSLGRTVITFAGTPEGNHTLIDGFSFLNWSRKQNFVKLLKSYGDFSAYCPGDEEMYFKSGKMSDGSSLCALFNIGLDIIDNVELVINRDFSKIQKLMPDGSRADVGYKTENDKTILDCPAHILDPIILIIS